MTDRKVYTVIGLMSGTALDGIDAALLRTDGSAYIEPLDFVTLPYEKLDRRKIRAAFGQSDLMNDDVRAAEKLSTDLHIQAVQALLEKSGHTATDIDVIGYHGQTIFHAPQDKVTIQIGDGSRMAQETGIDVVYDFRTNDVMAGGQGAPLIPLYHRAITANVTKPTAIVNIGGVANVTWIGGDMDRNILAFDVGTGNALIDDCIARNTEDSFDHDGCLASKGTIDESLVEKWLSHPFFSAQPPKSLDRDEWKIAADLDNLSLEDTVATLTAFTVKGIVRAADYMPERPVEWYICGGGRHNKVMMRWLNEQLDNNVKPVEDLGLDGDAIEAQGFGYFAVRSLLGEILTLPTTTNVSEPLTGGVLCPHNPHKIRQEA